MLFVDIRHWLNADMTSPGLPQLKRQVDRITGIISYITSFENGIPDCLPPKCWKKPNRKPCKEPLQIDFTVEGRISWICPACGDEGIISGWEGLRWDLGRNWPNA